MVVLLVLNLSHWNAQPLNDSENPEVPIGSRHNQSTARPQYTFELVVCKSRTHQMFDNFGAPNQVILVIGKGERFVGINCQGTGIMRFDIAGNNAKPFLLQLIFPVSVATADIQRLSCLGN